MDQIVITLILIFVPGILSAVIADKVTVHQRWDSFKFGLYALILGLLSYASLQIIFWTYEYGQSILYGENASFEPLLIWNALLNQGDGLIGFEVFFASVLAFPIALGASAVINFKIINRIAQRIRVSNKFGDENLYSYYLNAKEVDWVYVRDFDQNLTYQGSVISHAENSQMQELVLAEVSVFRYEDSEHLYNVPSIYLSRPLGSLVVEAVPLSHMEKRK